jgi:HAD superfamily hydrolase (TIGR01549 family)
VQDGLPQVKGIFFDFYDTLMVSQENTPTLWMNEFHGCLQSFGLALPIAAFAAKLNDFFSSYDPPANRPELSVYEKRIAALCGELGIAVDVEGLHRTAMRTIEATNSSCYLATDCHDVLRILQKRYTLALITNYDHPPYMKQLLEKFGLNRYFHTIIISGETGTKKPDPAIFRLALEQTGLKPDEVIHVGDSVRDDVNGALASGITPVLIQRKDPRGVPYTEQQEDFWDRQSRTCPAGITVIETLTGLVEKLT